MLHGLDICSRDAAYGAVFVPAIRHCDAIIANSQFTASLAERRGVRPDHIHTIHPGVDEPDSVTQNDIKAFRARIGAADRPILLSVGRLAERKGLVEFVTNCLPDIVSKIPNVLMMIIGSDATDALIAQKSVAERLKSVIAELHLGNHVAMLGQVDDPSLHIAYAASDLHVFPVLDRPTDIEGFGMVAVEAASYGLPTVAFAVGGVVDAVSPGVSGELVPSGDYAHFEKCVIEHFLKCPLASSESCREFASRFHWAHYGRHLLDISNILLAVEPGKQAA
jgi:phosphatidyl-myo-inositol dimannoside synthase